MPVEELQVYELLFVHRVLTRITDTKEIWLVLNTYQQSRTYDCCSRKLRTVSYHQKKNRIFFIFQMKHLETGVPRQNKIKMQSVRQ